MKAHRLASMTVLLPLILLPATAQAHGAGESSGHGPLWTRWTIDLLLMTNLTILASIYAFGLTRLWRSSGGRRLVSRWQAASFAAGLLALLLALGSPLDALADELGSAHMIQHLILMNVAAPLLILGAPGFVALWTLPPAWRTTVGAVRRSTLGRATLYVIWQPIILWSLFALSLWIWHIPVLYEATLHNDVIHGLQHALFVITGCSFWRVLLDPISRMRMGFGLGVLYIFATSVHATALAVFMTLSPVVWYPTYKERTMAWGLTAIEDQQIAGVIMWMPACLIYVGVAAVIFSRWLRQLDQAPRLGRSPAS